MKKFGMSLLEKLGGLGAAALTQGWMSTLDYQGLFYDRTTDPAHPEFRGPAIFLFWHEYIPFLFYIRSHCHTAMLVSRHRDAELLSQAARHMGFQIVRGSTNRGGTTALRELFRKSQRLNLAITPDGPRGPRRQLAPGPVYLSSRLGIPLIAIGLGYDRPWEMPTWDRFKVPRPFSRARGIVGPKIQIAPDLDRDGLEEQRRHVEGVLNRLTEEAEAWARDGTRRENQETVWRQPAALRSWRIDAAEQPLRGQNPESSRMRSTINQAYR